MPNALLKQRTIARISLSSLTLFLSATMASKVQAEIAWRTDLTTAHAEAQSQGKPLLLHFYSDNCIWCDRLEAGAFQAPNVGSAVAQGFVPVKVHAGKSPELAKMFQVTKFPTDVVVTPAGKTLTRTVSPQEPARYVAMLAQASSQMPAAGPAVPPSPTGNLQPGTQIAANSATGPTAGTPAAPQMQLPKKQTMPTQQVAVSAPPKSAPVMNPHVAANTAGPTNAKTASAPKGTGMQLPGGATAQLAGARTDGMTLGMPAQVAPATESIAQADSTPADSTPTSDEPKLAMEGYCAVTVIDEDRWEEGNPKFGVVHLGKLYLFASTEKMEMFLADPTPYTPVLNEIDVIRFFEERKIVPGKREFGMKDPVHQRMFFFADEAAMNHFYNEYQRYTDAAIEVMQRAVKDANGDAS